MFSGTIRDNLDPYREIDDTELQAALEGSGLVSIGDNSACGLSSTSGTTSPTESISSRTISKTKKIGLDSLVTTGGDNLSQGQRQLLAFARALVRRSKLVILDEVWSPVPRVWMPSGALASRPQRIRRLGIISLPMLPRKPKTELTPVSTQATSSTDMET